MAHTKPDEEELMKRKRGEEMRLTVSQYLSRLPNRTTNTFWRDALLGDTSLTAGASSPTSWPFDQLCFDPEKWHARQA